MSLFWRTGLPAAACLPQQDDCRLMLLLLLPLIALCTQFLLERRLAEEQGPEALATFDALHAGDSDHTEDGHTEGDNSTTGASPAGNAHGTAAAEGGVDAASAGAEGSDAKGKLSSDVLLGMDQSAAHNILDHMGFKDKAGILASLDPTKVGWVMTG